MMPLVISSNRLTAIIIPLRYDELMFYIDNLYFLGLYLTLFPIQQFVVDMMCLTPPWTLLFLSKDLRQMVFWMNTKNTIVTSTIKNGALTKK
uniref:Uncharacterized protein n=1 Tax=Acrobeloides nanus TaxID=290746 RepID=A0A914D5A6_9BILA